MVRALGHDEVAVIERRVRSFFRKKLTHENDVDDLVQTTLVAVVRSTSAVKDETKLFAWVDTIARNTLYNHFTRNRVRQWELLAEQAESRHSQAERELYTAIDEVLDTLSVVEADFPQKFAVALRLCFDWSPRAISEIMSANLTTTYSRLQAGMLKLKNARRVVFDLEEKVLLVHWIAAAMGMAAKYPFNGRQMHDTSLLYQAYYLVKNALDRHPGHYRLIGSRACVAYLLGLLADNGPDEIFMYDNDPQSLDRSKLNRVWIERGDESLRELRKASPAKPCKDYIELLAYANYYHCIFSPAAYEDIDHGQLKKTRELFERCGRYEVVPSILMMIEDPLAAARYMLQLQRRQGNPSFLPYYLASFYYKAGKWREAARWYKKALRLPLNDSRREFARERLRLCKARFTK